MRHDAHLSRNTVLNRRAFMARLPFLAAGFLQAGSSYAGARLSRTERALFNVRESFVQGCRALAGTKTWAVVAGAHTAHLREAGNDFTQALQSFELAAHVPAGAATIDSRPAR
jgi:hypothetical protein